MRINPDSNFVHVSVAVFDAVIATFLFFLCCIPVITVGASATALHKVMLGIARGEGGGVLRTFFGAFKADIKTGTVLWLLALFVGCIVAGDVYVCFGFEMERTLMLSMMQGLTIGCTLLYTAVLSYLFAGLSAFEVTWKQALRNALIWTFKKPLHTLALLAVNAATVLCCYLASIWAFPVVALLLYARAVILNAAFGFKKIPTAAQSTGEEEIYYG